MGQAGLSLGAVAGSGLPESTCRVAGGHLLQWLCPECIGCSTTPNNNVRCHIPPTNQRLFIPTQSEAPSHWTSSRKPRMLKAVSSKTGADHGYTPRVVPKGQGWRSSLSQKKKNVQRQFWKGTATVHTQTHTHQPRSLWTPNVTRTHSSSHLQAKDKVTLQICFSVLCHQHMTVSLLGVSPQHPGVPVPKGEGCGALGEVMRAWVSGTAWGYHAEFCTSGKALRGTGTYSHQPFLKL